MNQSLEQACKEIDAHHQVFLQQRAEIVLLRIRLRIARGQYVSLKERWKMVEIVARYPHLGE